VARPSYPVGEAIAKVVAAPEEASRLVAHGTPSVLVGPDARLLGQLLRDAPDEGARDRLLGVMVGDPEAGDVHAAAQEMAGELWQWAKKPGGPDADDVRA